jgi:hypothetical protein
MGRRSFAACIHSGEKCSKAVSGPARSESRQKIADWLPDDAVSCELLSASNSLIIRENTGNIRDFGRFGADLKPKNSSILSGI